LIIGRHDSAILNQVNIEVKAKLRKYDRMKKERMVLLLLLFSCPCLANSQVNNSSTAKGLISKFVSSNFIVKPTKAGVDSCYLNFKSLTMMHFALLIRMSNLMKLI
jgi:hypothetical protein